MAWDSPSHHAILIQEGARPFNSTAFSASRKPLKDPLLPSRSAAFLQLTSHPNGDHHALLQEAKEERPSFKEEEGSGSAGRDADPIGLKLGKRTYFEDSSSFTPNHSNGNGNGNNNGTNNTNNKAGGRASKPAARCQVEGCKADLSTAKDYHRRHKVCDPHSKAASAIVSGIEQRFCQQCSRFHVVSEFDEGKRSCRRRLASHNERRRKPKMDPLTMRLPALQNDACFSQFFLPRNSLPYSRTSGLPPYWEVLEQSKGYWSNSWNAGNDTLLTTEMGRQLFQQGNNNMLFFSPPNNISTQRGIQGVDSSSSDLIGEGLSLCSPPGSIAFSPLEAATNGTAITTTTTSTGSITGRHSNSGCALSLLSLLQPATSLELCMHSDMGAYQSLHVSEPSASSQPFIGGHHFGLDSDRMQKIGFNSDADRMWKIGFDSDRMQQVGFDSDRMRQIGLEESSDRMRQIGLDSNRIRQMGLDFDRMRQIGLDPDDRMRQIGLDPDDRMRQIGLDSNANRMRQIGLNSDDQMRRIGLDSDRMRQIGLDSDYRMRQIGFDSNDRIQKNALDSDSMRQIGLDSDFDQMRQIGLDSNRMRQIKHARDENATIDLMHVAPFSSRSSYDQSYLHAPSQGGGVQLGPNQYGNMHGLRSYGTFSI